MAYGFALASQAASFSSAHTPSRAPPGPAVGLAVTLARTPTDLRAAQLLLESLYAARGYLVSRLDANLASDLVLVAAENGEAIGTLTVRFDGPGGLRADESYRKELDAARAQGRRVCEFGRFAVARRARSEQVIGALFRHARHWVHDRGEITDVFIEVNPRHVAFYRGAFAFCVAGDERTCPRVHAPSVLLRLEVAAFEARLRAADGRPTDRPSRALIGAPLRA